MTTRHSHEWEHTHQEERAEIARRRGPGRPMDDDVVGLAISGGGIRSATFGLGVLETLKRLGVLEKVDYLSTVSGGGYIGAWLSANCHRNAGWLSPRADWLESIKHLRRYSNYLSPKVGFFSADTWSMATIWLRNTTLIQTTVVLAIACALLLPRPLFELFQVWPAAGFLRWATILLFVFGVVGIAGNQMRLTAHGTVAFLKGSNWLLGAVIGGGCLAAAWAFGLYVDFDPFHSGRVSYEHAAPIAGLLVLGGFALQPVAVKLTAAVWPWDDPPQQINYTQAWVQGAVVIPLMIAGFLVTAVLWGETLGTAPEGLADYVTYGSFLRTAWAYWPFPLSVVFVSIWLLSFCAIRSWRNGGDLFIAFAAPFVAVPVLHALLCAVMALFHQWKRNPDGTWMAFVWGPPLVALAFVVTIIVLVGMMSRQSTEDVREWWSRLGAWLGIYATAWMVLAVSAVYGPKLVQWAIEEHQWGTMTAGGGWVGTVIAGLLAGNSEHTGTSRKKSAGTRAKELMARAAPFIFIAGVLVAVAYGLESLILLNDGGGWARTPGERHEMFLAVSLGVGLGCLIGLVLLAWRVDINEFSLNAFYRNRLVRCYLGATRFRPNERQPQNFTGFDDRDDLPLAKLADKKVVLPGPLHIVNCALNLGGSSDLALHTRHSAAFTLGPLSCGSGYESRDQAGNTKQLGFVPTAQYGGEFDTPTLGQAIAVSGAAASPNMGYHTSPVVAFLLTLFNVRLGWWFQNPGQKATGYSSPHFSLRYLVSELFGGADDKSQFVMISDGGHFENLGVYELVRRRCRVIIASDAECDPQLALDGLGTLIRMCEVDFGATITIDAGPIRVGGAPREPDPDAATPWSTARYAVGTIDYGGAAPNGVFIYVKASMTGKEDTAVMQYKATHPAFPHESTGDQFYGEDQFESYRRLGRDVAASAFEQQLRTQPDLTKWLPT